ncbi:MAG: hypothetical protein HDR26_10780, partial [Lachnospiraceae bacterium]|nr:hypothetical protein [Lachnospiraceae bacterium]
MREKETHYLTGEGSFFLAAENEREFCQEFIPGHDAVLDLVGISFHKAESESADCEIYVSVKDGEDNLLFEKSLDFAELNNNAYTYIDTKIRLKKGALYYLRINFDIGNDVTLGVNACSREYELEENRDFYQGGERLESQLVTMYSYSDVLPGENAGIVYLLGFLAALGIAVGPPRHKKWNFAFGAGIFLLTPPVLGYYLEMLATDMTQLLQENLWINIGLIYGIWLILLLLTLSWRITVTAGTFFVSILYIVNYYFMRFRGTPFKLG